MQWDCTIDKCSNVFWILIVLHSLLLIAGIIVVRTDSTGYEDGLTDFHHWLFTLIFVVLFPFVFIVRSVVVWKCMDMEFAPACDKVVKDGLGFYGGPAEMKILLKKHSK